MRHDYYALLTYISRDTRFLTYNTELELGFRFQTISFEIEFFSLSPSLFLFQYNAFSWFQIDTVCMVKRLVHSL